MYIYVYKPIYHEELSAREGIKTSPLPIRFIDSAYPGGEIIIIIIIIISVAALSLAVLKENTNNKFIS
jgi:hypothetical protein